MRIGLAGPLSSVEEGIETTAASAEAADLSISFAQRRVRLSA